MRGCTVTSRRAGLASRDETAGGRHRARRTSLNCNLSAFAVPLLLLSILLMATPTQALSTGALKMYGVPGTVDIWMANRAGGQAQITETVQVICYLDSNITVQVVGANNRTYTTFNVGARSSLYSEFQFTDWNMTYAVNVVSNGTLLFTMSMYRPQINQGYVPPSPIPWDPTPEPNNTTIPGAIYTEKDRLDWLQQQQEKFADSALIGVAMCIPIIIIAGYLGRTVRLWSRFPAPYDFGTVPLLTVTALFLYYTSMKSNFGDFMAALWFGVFLSVFVMVFMWIPLKGVPIAKPNVERHTIAEGMYMVTYIDDQGRLCWQKPTWKELYKTKFQGMPWLIITNGPVDSRWDKNVNLWGIDVPLANGRAKFDLLAAEDIKHDEKARTTTIVLAPAAWMEMLEGIMNVESHVKKTRKIEKLNRQVIDLKYNEAARVSSKLTDLLTEALNKRTRVDALRHYQDYDAEPEEKVKEQVPEVTTQEERKEIAVEAEKTDELKPEEEKRPRGEDNGKRN
jgi:hypothetical protein